MATTLGMKQRHVELHRDLDELVACYFTQNTQKLASETTLMEFMTWSHKMTINPSCASVIEEQHGPTPTNGS